LRYVLNLEPTKIKKYIKLFYKDYIHIGTFTYIVND
jgi:hypothetical protein